jgi:hypothetical protein
MKLLAPAPAPVRHYRFHVPAQGNGRAITTWSANMGHIAGFTTANASYHGCTLYSYSNCETQCELHKETTIV